MDRFVKMNSMPSTNSYASYGGGMSRGFMFLLVFLAIFVVGVCIYFFYSLPVPASNPGVQQQQQGSSNGGEAELMFFYTDWCPHCKTAKPVWNEIKSEYENKTINGYTVVFTEINCTEENAEVEKMMNQYKIEGYPTIKLLKDGQVIEYDAKPSKETMAQFLNTVL